MIPAMALAGAITALRTRKLDDLIVGYRRWLHATGHCCGHPAQALEMRQCRDAMPNILTLVKCRVCRRVWVEVEA